MTVEVTPVGNRCNLRCVYCYEDPMRRAGTHMDNAPHDLVKMKVALTAAGAPFNLFGGEPLLLPLDELEELLRLGVEMYGATRTGTVNSIQSNGTLITDAHVALFLKYRTSVGVSVDGPEELNDARWAGTLEETRRHTRLSHENIEKCLKAGLTTSIIVTLTRKNGLPEHRSRMKAWFKRWESLGMTGARLHLMEWESDAVRTMFALSDDEAIDALCDLATFERDELATLRFDIFADMTRALLGEDSCITCIWAACDPYTTAAVHGVDGQGERINCGHNTKEGVAWLKADQPGWERQLALYHTPQEFHGCKDCRFFLMCRGSCPGPSVDYDWRNRTVHCAVWQALLGLQERALVRGGQAPLSLYAKRGEVEAAYVRHLGQGRSPSVQSLYAAVVAGTDPGAVFRGASTPHGDHYDGQARPHGDVQHGDVQHGDQQHGDVQHGDSRPGAIRGAAPVEVAR